MAFGSNILEPVESMCIDSMAWRQLSLAVLGQELRIIVRGGRDQEMDVLFIGEIHTTLCLVLISLGLDSTQFLQWVNGILQHDSLKCV